jgi:hypothetical protein
MTENDRYCPTLVAKSIAGDAAARELVELAHRIVGAGIDPLRVRRARSDMMSRELDTEGICLQEGREIRETK